MAILSVTGLGKYWGTDLLFKDVDCLMNEGEKIALVGRSGTGKTTLLRILAGRLEYDGGSIQMPAGCRVGYLSQDPEFTAGRTLLQEAQSVHAHLDEWEQALRNLEGRMGAVQDQEELHAVMEEYARLMARYEAAGAYEAPARVKAVLFGLGFGEEDLARPVEVLSGGQKVRMGLAKLLLDEPDLMLLDEPTNHLDLQATEWLEIYFKRMKSAAILVSHDRYFLDKVVSRTLALENSRAEIYHGNYSYYLKESELRRESAMTTYEKQQKEAARLQQFYEKWRSTPSRKDQAMSRKRMLDRMEIMDRPAARRKSMKLEFRVERASGKEALKVKGLGMAFGEHVIFSDVNLQAVKGDRIALVGPNGSGKTTFLKAIHGILQPSTGTCHWGIGVERGYFSQDLDALDYGRTCMEEMLEIEGFTKFDAHSLLGRFLFSGDDAHKLIAQCSGGERNRLTLARLTAAGANVLLLDEPTNHLDLESKAVLEEALREYPGTILFVSHDRYFVDRVATKVWEFGGEGVAEYVGNYSHYKAEKERRATLAPSGPPQASRPAETARQEAARARAEARKAEEVRRAAQEGLRQLEREIQQLEERKAELETRMCDPHIYKTDDGRETVLAYHTIQEDLTRLYEEWTRAGEEGDLSS